MAARLRTLPAAVAPSTGASSGVRGRNPEASAAQARAAALVAH